jgi:hypothetical protein
MIPRKREIFEPVTLGHIRSHGCRDLLIYCDSIQCSYSAKMNADHLSDDMPIRPLGARMVCSRCGPSRRRCAARLVTAHEPKAGMTKAAGQWPLPGVLASIRLITSIADLRW